MQTTHPSKASLWTGRVISGLVVLLLAMDGVMKLVKPAPVMEATTKLGIAENVVTPIGLILLVATALYALRSTAVLGAIVLTGFLGGACATNLRADTPLFNVLFPVGVGMLAWVGLVLRNPKLQSILVPGAASSTLSLS